MFSLPRSRALGSCWPVCPARLDRPGGDAGPATTCAADSAGGSGAQDAQTDHTHLLADRRTIRRTAASRSGPTLAARMEQPRSTTTSEGGFSRQKPSEYEIPDGLRLLATSRRRLLDRIFTSWHWRIILQRATVACRRASAQNWPPRPTYQTGIPRHFLDTDGDDRQFASATTGSFDDWTKDQRAELRQAIVQKGLVPGLKSLPVQGVVVDRPQQLEPGLQRRPGDRRFGHRRRGAAVAREILHSGLHSLPLCHDAVWPRRRLGEGPGLLGLRDQVQRAHLGGAADGLGARTSPVGLPRLLAVRHDAESIRPDDRQELQLRGQRR